MVVIIILVIHTNAFLKDKFTPSSPIRWRKWTNSEEAHGAYGVNSCMPQK